MKTVFVKVYTPGGTFLKLWDKITFESFTKELNAGLGECVLTLGEAFDYQGGELEIGNLVDVSISDKDTQVLLPSEKLIYSGYISKYEPFVLGGREMITVRLLGHYTKFALDILKNSNTTKLFTDTTNGLTTVSATSADVGTIMKAIIDRYRAETTNPKINYTGESLKITGTTVLYTFDQKTYREAIDKMRACAPANWYWYVDENGLFWFKEKPTTPTHKFIFGRHFSSIKVEKDMEKLRNALLFWNGESVPLDIYKLYENAASIIQYGRRVEKYFDYGVGDVASANIIGNKFIAENATPAVMVVCEILDNNENPSFGYDIESIQPGDTCSFYGFNQKLADLFQEAMLITKVVYTLNKVELTVEAVKAGLIDWQEQTSKSLDDYQSDGSPATYS